MPPAARVGDTTTHGGTITGPGVATVLIGGQPAAVAGDLHACSLPPNAHPLTVSPFPMGSATVLFGGRPAIHATDTCICGAMAAVGAPTAMIGVDVNGTGTRAPFLGRGWSFPPEFSDAASDVLMTEDQADIDASLRILFGTAAGERFLVPTYGLDMRELQFEPMSTSMRTFLLDRIKTAILIFEPRITVLSLDVRNPTERDGTLLIALEYMVRATNSRFNLVYPFYWTDATEVSVPGGGA